MVCTGARPWNSDPDGHPHLDGLDDRPPDDRDYGIPVGLPYLLGFVIQAAIDEELANSTLTT